MTTPSYLLLEDGSKIILEDASGFILLESEAASTQTFGNLGFFDIGGEPEGVEEFKRKQAQLARDVRRAYYNDDDDEEAILWLM